jgi:hypothetical protein
MPSTRCSDRMARRMKHLHGRLYPKRLLNEMVLEVCAQQVSDSRWAARSIRCGGYGHRPRLAPKRLTGSSDHENLGTVPGGFVSDKRPKFTAKARSSPSLRTRKEAPGAGQSILNRQNAGTVPAFFVSIDVFPDFSYSYSALAVLVLVLEDTTSSTSTISLSTSTIKTKTAQLQKLTGGSTYR